MQSNLIKYIAVSAAVAALMLAPTAFAASKKPARAHQSDGSSVQLPIILGDPQTQNNDPASSTGSSTTSAATSSDASTTPPAPVDTTPAPIDNTPTPTTIPTPPPQPAPSNPKTHVVSAITPTTSSPTASSTATTTAAGIASNQAPLGGLGSIYTDTKISAIESQFLLAVALALGVAGFMLVESDSLSALFARRARVRVRRFEA